MSLARALFQALAPPAVTQAVAVAEEHVTAVEAAKVALAEGHGPIVALRLFAAATSEAWDDDTAERAEAAVRSALVALERLCAAGASLAEHEPQFRAAVDTTLSALFGAAYAAAAWRHTLKGWLDGETH